jgi:hypothetical protein
MDSHEHGALRSGGVENGACVDDPLVCGDIGRPIGEARSASVQNDQTVTRGHSTDELIDGWLRPELEMADEARDYYDVGRPVANHLVGDMNAIVGDCVTNR